MKHVIKNPVASKALPPRAGGSPPVFSIEGSRRGSEMHFAGIDVDDELIQASRSGDLAIFAGAGVSMGEPTKLPGFGSLIEEIRELVDPAHRFNDRNDESSIRYLGYLEKECGGVHEA